MAYKSFIKNIGTTARAGVGFLPVPGDGFIPNAIIPVITNANTPDATITFDALGTYAAGTLFNCGFIPNTASGSFAPLTITANLTAAEVVQQWAALIVGINDVTAVGAANVITVNPFGAAVSVEVVTLTMDLP